MGRPHDHELAVLPGEIPFKDVVIYATILAKDGSRMSKSKGNGVDPMDLIAKYGADAMRFNLLTLVTNNQDVKFDANIDKKTHELIDSPRTEQARAFVTKIWNASRFVFMNLDGYTPGEPARTRRPTPGCSVAWRPLTMVTQGIALQVRRYGPRPARVLLERGLRLVHRVLARRACAKGEDRLQAQRNLVYVLDTSIRLLHPLMPFVTEDIWENVPHAEGEAPALMMAKWPEPESLASLVDEESERAVSLLCDVVSAVRSTRARYGISPKQELPVVLRAGFENARVLEGLKSQIISMARASELSIVPSDAHKPAERLRRRARVRGVLRAHRPYRLRGRARTPHQGARNASEGRGQVRQEAFQPRLPREGSARDRGEGRRRSLPSCAISLHA